MLSCLFILLLLPLLKSRFIIIVSLFNIVLFLCLPIYSLTGEKTQKKQVIYHILPHNIDQMEDMLYASFLDQTINKKALKEENLALIIVEIDTPGGELQATLKIEKTIQSSKFPTVCFINQNAISAGSLIALSCDKLVMSPGARIGAATPITIGSGGMKKAPEKIVSASRAIWRGAAERQGKNPDIAESFVDENLVLTKAKHGINKPKGKLLTLTTKEAAKLKMLDYTAKTVQEIIKKEGFSKSKFKVRVENIQPDFGHKLLGFFLHPVIAGALITLGFLGLLYEVKVGGWGVPGTLGIIFLSIYFISKILIGEAGWGAPALFAVGGMLVTLEIFVIPGFGIAGILGLISVITSILWAYGISNFQEGLWVLAFSLMGLTISILMIMKYLPVMNNKREGLFLKDTLQSYENTPHLYTNLIGKKGVSQTNLRPSGTVKIGEKNYDAMSQGDFIPLNTPIKVVGAEGSHINVVKSS